MLQNFLTIFRVASKTMNVLRTILLTLFMSFLVYIQFNTKSHLIKYDGVPCQNKIFSLNKPMERVIGGKSTMREGYYHVTRNILQDIHDDYQTVQKTGQIYPKSSRFKVISSYVAFDSGPLSGLGGRPTSEYLMQSMGTGDYMWVSYFEFDAKSCTISDSSDAVHFDVEQHKFDKNITKTIIAI